ncbi:MAG: hypothetical protein GEU28_04760 [Dehalococcoidia bacterium]|nr:hypothetical protein [Dehalococcoidia bacterium]
MAHASIIATGEVIAGMHLGVHQHEMTEEVLAEYASAVKDDNPWYRIQSPYGRPVAPALITHKEVFNFPGWYLPNVYGNLHARQEWELFNPALLGDTISTSGNVVGRYVKRGRDFVVTEVTATHAGGQLVSRSRTHQSFLMDHQKDNMAVEKGRKKTEPAVADEPAVLEQIRGPLKLVDQEMCLKYSGPTRNYHNDVDAARKRGFPDIVVQGSMSICFISELMTRRFGEGWYTGGRMAVNLIDVLWGGEQTRACASINKYTPEGKARRAHLTVWTEKDSGAKTVVGQASALVH